MAIKNVLVVLNSYPDPTPVVAVQSAVAVGSLLGVHVAALSCEIHMQVPRHFLGDSVVNISGIIAGEAKKSRKSAQDLLAAFDAAAEKSGVLHEAIMQKCLTVDVPDVLVDYSRLYDLTIIPVAKSGDQRYVEALIFGSGKPTLILPEAPLTRPFELGTLAVAWDASRAAARAISDALPILEKARQVRVVTVFNEKILDTKHSAEELTKNLSRHGINVVLDKVDAGGKQIGDVLDAYTAAHSVDMLVMGAYGHSRLREFFLGGATKSALSNPRLPILLSH